MVLEFLHVPMEGKIGSGLKSFVLVGNGEKLSRDFSSLVGKQRLVAQYH